MLEGLKRNQAVIVNEDGSGSEPIGAASLESKLAESEGAKGLVFAGKVTDRIFTLAAGAGIDSVVASSVGKVTRKSGVQAYSASHRCRLFGTRLQQQLLLSYLQTQVTYTMLPQP